MTGSLNLVSIKMCTLEIQSQFVDYFQRTRSSNKYSNIIIYAQHYFVGSVDIGYIEKPSQGCYLIC